MKNAACGCPHTRAGNRRDAAGALRSTIEAEKESGLESGRGAPCLTTREPGAWRYGEGWSYECQRARMPEEVDAGSDRLGVHSGSNKTTGRRESETRIAVPGRCLREIAAFWWPRRLERIGFEVSRLWLRFSRGSRRLPKHACGQWRDGGSIRLRRSWSSSARGSHASSRVCGDWVEMCAWA